MKSIIRLFTIALIVNILFTGCEKSLLSIRGEGPIVAQTFSVSSFDEVDLAGAFDIVVSEGDVQEVVIEGQQNIIDRLILNVSGNNLEIKLQRGNYKNYDLVVFITVPDIEEVNISGSGDIEINHFDSLDNLYLSIEGSGNIISRTNSVVDNLSFEISGSGNIDYATTSQSVYCGISGSGDIKLEGTTVSQELSISGSGNYDTFDLLCQNTDIDISGSGNCEVNASSALTVSISGSGDVYYMGTPSINSNISGSGSVIRR